MRVLLTGGYGFIGSAVVRHLIENTRHDVLNIDSLTYAASPDAVADVAADSRYGFRQCDICDTAAVGRILDAYRPDAVMHLAAESHVDRSIDSAGVFMRTNIMGTFSMLEAVRAYWRELPPARRAAFRFHHVSTDEVFGMLGPHDPPFTEATPYNPSSPYSASKAASDHLVRAWHHTYGLPAFITNTTNNYGIWHFPEKLVPLTIINALEGRTLPVYGAGDNVRDWLFVSDHAEALVRAVEHGRPGGTYAIGARQPRTNLEVVRAICAVLDRLRPDPAGPHARLIRHVPDRPGHDFRYEIDPTHAERALGWTARHDFESGLELTVRWYIDHAPWWRAIRARQQASLPMGRVA